MAEAFKACGLVKAARELFWLQVVRALWGWEPSAAGGPGLGSGGLRLRLRGQVTPALLLVCTYYRSLVELVWLPCCSDSIVRVGSRSSPPSFSL